VDSTAAGVWIANGGTRHTEVVLDDDQQVLLRSRLVPGEPASLCRVPVSVRSLLLSIQFSKIVPGTTRAPVLEPKLQLINGSHRITESQNVRGWKGPLWII